jgi:hypothetical protein
MYALVLFVAIIQGNARHYPSFSGLEVSKKKKKGFNCNMESRCQESHKPEASQEECLNGRVKL